MFLIIPLVEFLHVLGVDINVHHENPATFLCHVSVSSVNRSRRRLPRLVGTRTSAPGAQERYETTNRGPKLQRQQRRRGDTAAGGGGPGFRSFSAHAMSEIWTTALSTA